VIADEISDPHNLGALIRTAECCGVHGIILPKRRSAGVGATVAKTSAGAVSFMNIAKVTNLSAAIDTLKQNGIWIYGADGDGEKSAFDTDFKGPVALVIGSEGYGMNRLVREKCDFIVKIPMFGQVNSLNASVAGAILMYEVVRKKKIPGISSGK
jgi:23S rRNA (guanosine2251-2'-O)-methyltransferase